MKPIKFPEANKTLGKPQGMTDDECGPLPVFSDGKCASHAGRWAGVNGWLRCFLGGRGYMCISVPLSRLWRWKR